MMNYKKHHPLMKILSGALWDLPSPSSINSMWNFGSLLGLCLGAQIATGLLLSLHYSGDVDLAFSSVSHMSRDVSGGWLLRVAHANGASAFFLCLYLHIARGITYGSYLHIETWNLGVFLLLAVMAAAFLGYVLPWGQMSFWGATVITNLFSAIPYLGPDIVTWLWGGFAVDNATLTRFFAFHFLTPLVVVGLVGVHLLFLHQSGSSNPLGLSMSSDKAPFHPYFSWKDSAGFLLASLIFSAFVLQAPWVLGDPENFIPANPLVTPLHIQPEWYFLFAYAILRSIPNKLGGVIALAFSVLALFVLPLYTSAKFQGATWYPASKLWIWLFFNTTTLLTWIGARPVEEPYVLTGQALTVCYFLFFPVLPLSAVLWDWALGYHKL